MPELDLPRLKRKAPVTGVSLRLRHARLVAGLTIRELSDRAACSDSLISRYENNSAKPTPAALSRLAEALKVSVSELTSEKKMGSSQVMRLGERPQTSSGEIALEHLILPGQNALLQATIHVVQGGGRQECVRQHAGEELGYVLQGKMELMLNNMRSVLGAGDSFNFASWQPHSYHNIGSDILKILWVRTPALA